MLHPAISGTAWDTGISTRIVLFRDWIFQASESGSSQGEYIPGVRFAGVFKAKGISYEGVGKVATFVIEEVSPLDHRRAKSFSEYMQTGLREITVDQKNIILNASPVLPAPSSKRKRGEIADSQSEDEEADSDREFGWAADDDMTTTKAELD